MARDAPGGDSCEELDQTKYDADENVKIICLGDSAVGKSKLMERFLLDGFRPQQLSTFALTLYKYTTSVDGKNILVDFWDTAGQERFQSMHASYYHKAHACIMVRAFFWLSLCVCKGFLAGNRTCLVCILHITFNNVTLSTAS
uniref:Uncharacterized protein n=1 Tax=Chelonoidis abingdonii TaxID=106734 RepID=A0A8C0G6Y3_CHEAB